MDTTFLPMALPLALALVVVLTGPGLIVARAVARWALPAPQARARAASLRFGLALATVLAALFALIDPQMGLMLTLCMVCLWLGLSDWTWRWLPLPWVLALWAAGLAHGWFEDAWIGPLIASLAVLACLFALQVSYQGVRGKEGLGTGDILFLGAIAGWIGLPDTFLVILAAAISGLLLEGVPKMLGQQAARRRYGVAFGTYLAAMFAIMVVLRHPV